MAEVTAPPAIIVEVAWAEPARQLLLSLTVPLGTTAAEAVACSGLDALLGGGERPPAVYGLFGKLVPVNHPLRDGDRVEVLRSLLADPKEVRRALAAQGRTMGKPVPKRGT